MVSPLGIPYIIYTMYCVVFVTMIELLEYNFLLMFVTGCLIIHNLFVSTSYHSLMQKVETTHG